VYYGEHKSMGQVHDVVYMVNRSKRTVVALIKLDNVIRARGIAKCMEGDVFNVHIGMAIALAKALGKEVPTEFVNAPQPNRVHIGDVVKYNHGRVSEVVLQRPICNDQYTAFSFVDSEFEKKHVTIIDDSRDGRYNDGMYTVGA